MTSRITELVVDAHDPERLAAFWCEVLGWSVLDRYDGQVEIGASPEEQQGPTLVFVPTTNAKLQKLRLHVDVRPVDGDHEAELQRLLDVGAVRVDVGQGDAPWVVLADPEGNEFCLLHPLGQPAD